jgi:hypothetical protein
MNLYERAKADNRRIHNNQMGFNVPMTITNPAGQSQTLRGSYIDTGLSLSPETGLPIQARRIAAHVHLADLSIGDPADDETGTWRVSFENTVGETVSGVIEAPMADRTLGMLSLTVRLVTVVS